jgi:hypothetical protein
MFSLRIRSLRVVLVVAIVAAAGMLAEARVDVRVAFDKTFDFKSVRTWGWHTEKKGEVMMARTQKDDPDALRKRAEPLIIDAVTTELAKLKIQPSTTEPQLTLTYFLLLTTNTSAQTVGQFLPATLEWGLPPFDAATQSLKLMNRGSLVFDLNAKDKIVWRGVADAKVDVYANDQEREKTLREAVRDLIKKYPKS